jgi:hypothetical protein
MYILPNQAALQESVPVLLYYYMKCTKGKVFTHISLKPKCKSCTMEAIITTDHATLNAYFDAKEQWSSTLVGRAFQKIQVGLSKRQITHHLMHTLTQKNNGLL